MFRPRPSCTIVFTPLTAHLNMSLRTPMRKTLFRSGLIRNKVVTLTVGNRVVHRRTNIHDCDDAGEDAAPVAHALCNRRQVQVQCTLLAQARCTPRREQVLRNSLTQAPDTPRLCHRRMPHVLSDRCRCSVPCSATLLAQAPCTPRPEQVLRVSLAQGKRTPRQVQVQRPL